MGECIRSVADRPHCDINDTKSRLWPRLSPTLSFKNCMHLPRWLRQNRVTCLQLCTACRENAELRSECCRDQVDVPLCRPVLSWRSIYFRNIFGIALSWKSSKTTILFFWCCKIDFTLSLKNCSTLSPLVSNVAWLISIPVNQDSYFLKSDIRRNVLSSCNSGESQKTCRRFNGVADFQWRKIFSVA